MSKITDKKISHAFLIEFIILGAIGIFIFSSHAYQGFCASMRHGVTGWNLRDICDMELSFVAY